MHWFTVILLLNHILEIKNFWIFGAWMTARFTVIEALKNFIGEYENSIEN